MKLKKFKEKNRKRIGMIVFTIVCVLLISVSILYRTFAIFEVRTNQNVINGTVQDPGNVYFAFHYDGSIQKDMPDKSKEYVLDESQSYCGVNGENDEKIKVTLTEDYQIHINGVTTSRTKCNLYFVKGKFIMGRGIPVVAKGGGLYEVEHKEVTETTDDTGFSETEYRYAGLDPNNYITFNNEKWRIIGLVNVMTSESKAEQRIKIVRNETLGKYSWDTSEENIYGTNDWEQAKLNTLLNNFYYNSLESQMCYNNTNTSVPCSFNQNGIKEDTKNIIESVYWNLGGIDNSNHTPLEMYNLERGKNVFTDRKYLLKFNIGLYYPSDYGYAAEENESHTRQECLELDMVSYAQKKCYLNWLGFTNETDKWLLTPISIDGVHITRIYSKGELASGGSPYGGDSIHPTLYLKPNVKIISGTGTIDNSYQLAQTVN